MATNCLDIGKHQFIYSFGSIDFDISLLFGISGSAVELCVQGMQLSFIYPSHSSTCIKRTNSKRILSFFIVIFAGMGRHECRILSCNLFDILGD